LLKLISIETRTANDAVLFIEAHVYVEKPALRLTEHQAKQLLSAHPQLAEHACRQLGVGRFGDKILAASLPHVLEHLAIDMLVGALSTQVTGTTKWLNRAEGMALVRLRIPATKSTNQELLVYVESALRELCKLLTADEPATV
jgi:hypothetical protein